MAAIAPAPLPCPIAPAPLPRPKRTRRSVGMQPTNPNAFSLDPLDRAGNERRDPEWVKAQQEREDARLLLLSRGNVGLPLSGKSV